MEQFPTTTKDLYVEMYCRRKAVTIEEHTGTELEIAKQNLQIEALKSWILLSRDAKQLFHEKLNECHRSYKKMFADYLESSSELYMKQKKRKESRKDDIMEPIEQQTQSHNEDDQNSVSEIERDDQNSLLTIHREEPMETQPEDIVSTYEEPLHSNTIPSMPYSEPEPSPPTALTARRLFELTCRTNSNWFSLSKSEKARYKNAVATLKRQYINKYRSFLEQLSDRDLYEHYVKTLC